jgi:hypothetical protein
VRWIWALGAVAFGMIVAGLLIDDSARTEKIEDAQPVANSRPADSPAPIPIVDQMQPGYEFYLPRLPHDQRRRPLVGDFWTPAEFDRAFPEEGSRSRFETNVPAR